MTHTTLLPEALRDSLTDHGITSTYLRMPGQLLNAAAEGATRFTTAALDRHATPIDMMTTSAKWMHSAFDRKPPTWSTAHEVSRVWPLARLRDFSTEPTSPAVPVLVLPPQAGHDSCIVDFADGQSQIQTVLSAGIGRVASLDWIGATRETRNATVEDYLTIIDEAIDVLGGQVHLVGDCQGGWLAAIYAAMHPERVRTLAIAGAPIDTRCGKPQIQQWLTLMSPAHHLTVHRMLVAANRGIWPGRYQLAGFEAMEPASKFERLSRLFGDAHDEDALARYAKFADWFEYTQDIGGAFYLWIIDHIFARNELARGVLRVAGSPVDLSRIDCPVYMIAGSRDHITPVEQVFAFEEHVSTASADIARHVAEAGHLGLFTGHHTLKAHWAPIFADMAAR